MSREIYANILEVKAQKRDGSRWVHKFKPGSKIIGNPDGSLSVRSAKGRKLFETVAPQSEAIYAQLAQEIGAQRLEQIYGLLDEVIGILEKPRPPVKSAAARSRAAVRRGKAGSGNG